MSKKYYLDQEGLERLVEYINMSLENKANKGDVPEDVVHNDQLADYVKNTELDPFINEDELAAELNNYVTKDSIDDVVRSDELENYATNDDLVDLRNSVTGVYHFRGSVANLEELQAIENPQAGDVYNIEDTGMNAAWTGDVWDEFGTVVDLTDYLTEDEVDGIPIPTVDSILFGGKFAFVNDVDGLKAMIDNDESEVEISLKEDLALTEPLVIPTGKSVTLNLGDNKISGTNALTVKGNVTLVDGEINCSRKAVIVDRGGQLVLEGTTINSTGNDGIDIQGGSEVIVNSGTVAAREAAIALFDGSSLTVNGGTVKGIDNGGVMGNGSAGRGGNNVVINDGYIEGNIITANYEACGIYWPNDGTLTINGGTIKANGGAGIVMRGGQVNINGGNIIATGEKGSSGWVGDNKNQVGVYAVVYDQSANYPAVDTLELNIGKNAILSSVEDTDIQILLSEGAVANINDERE